MTDHPILFQADMLRAILDGCKTQTRQVMPQQPPRGYKYRGDDGGNPFLLKDSGHYWTNGYAVWRPKLSRYGVAGDLLWVRETTKTWWRAESSPPPYHSYQWTEYRADGKCMKTGTHYFYKNEDKPEKWKPSIFMPKDICRNWSYQWTEYRADGKCMKTGTRYFYKNEDKPEKWKPSIFMPKDICRNWLKVKSNRVEQVQEITLDDIKAEGVTFDLIRNLLKPTKTKQGHWITGSDYDASEDYCYECAKKKVDELNTTDGDKDYVVDGGWENHDSDWYAHCEKCECLLNYWPTDHLFETELGAFESYGEIISLCNEDRYSFDTLCCAAPDQDEAIQDRVLKLCWRYLWDSTYAKPKPRYAKKKITHYESYPWKNGHKTLEHRGKPWHVYGNPHLFITEFERHNK